MGDDEWSVKFKALLSVPQFISKTLSDSNIFDPKEASFLILSACKSYYNSVKDNLNAYSIKVALSYILSYCWAAAKVLIVCTLYKIPTNGMILL